MRNGRIKYFSILGVVLFLYLTTSVYSLLICTYILLILPILSLVISLPGMRHVDVEKTHEHFIAKRNHLAYLHFKRVPYKYYPYYSYDGETIGYIINVPYRDSSWGVDFEDSIEKEYSKSVNNCEIKITLYKLKDNEKSGCVAKFKYGSIEYLLTGTMKQQEFEKILKNLVFPK